jgi:hypothetical protein
MEYNRKGHQEINCSPVDKMLKGPDSSRPAPDNEKMIFAFAIGEVVPSEKVEGLFKSKAFALKFHPVSVISIDCTYDIKAGISARPGR